MKTTSRKGFLRSFSTISLQRKLLLFVVIALSLIFAGSGIFIYILVNDTFMQSEKKHIAITAESLAPKVGVWYFVNKDSNNFHPDEFLKTLLFSYNLEYISFKDTDGSLISEVKIPAYIADDPYNIEYEKPLYTPQNGEARHMIGILKIAYGHHILEALSHKYYAASILVISLLALYFYLEMRLLKELLMPLRKIASEIKGYIPGKRLVFEPISEKRDDEISEIVNGFLHMQANIDIEMRRRETEEANNKAKDAFLMKQARFIEMGTMINNIAHQWKQPLNIIELCVTDLSIKSMIGTLDPQHQQKLFNDIHMQVAFMSKTIDIFKNFLNDDQNTKKMEIFSLKKAIEDTRQLLGNRLEKKKLSTKFILDERANVYGSINELEQVFLILINNAIDAGSTKITIECLAEEKERINLIRIYDNGGGFAPDILDRIFDAYFTTKHQSQGTGLGLFIAKMIVDMKFNGSIEAKNYNDGALFVIKLPFPSTDQR